MYGQTPLIFKQFRISVTFFSCGANMSSFEPNKEHLWHVLLFLFDQKKNANESRRLLMLTYGDYVPLRDAYVRWFRRFKSCCLAGVGGAGRPVQFP